MRKNGKIENLEKNSYPSPAVTGTYRLPNIPRAKRYSGQFQTVNTWHSELPAFFHVSMLKQGNWFWRKRESFKQHILLSIPEHLQFNIVDGLCIYHIGKKMMRQVVAFRPYNSGNEKWKWNRRGSFLFNPHQLWTLKGRKTSDSITEKNLMALTSWADSGKNALAEVQTPVQQRFYNCGQVRILMDKPSI